MAAEHPNRIALWAARNILEAATPMTLVVDGKTVKVTPQAPVPSSWEPRAEGLDVETDGPWPASVPIRCEWEGGQTTLKLSARVWRGSSENVAIGLDDVETRRNITYRNLAKLVAANSEADEAPVFASFSDFGRIGNDRAGHKARSARLKSLVTNSGLPLLSKTTVDLGRIRLEDGTIEPSARTTFERFIHVSLYKLDFFSRGPKAEQRGQPLINIGDLGLTDDDEAEAGDNDRAYWAGGFGEPERLSGFLKDKAWQINWARNEDTKGARQGWKHFDQIQVGDGFAIKGFGGNYQLTIHFVGEVASIDPEQGRIKLKELSGGPLYRGPAPRGQGAGSWFETVVPVTRDDVIELIFGEGLSDEQALTEHIDQPLNQILYGPPGTGKTYQLRETYFPLFTRASKGRPLDEETIANVPVFEVFAAALADLGGDASVADLTRHPFVRAKHQSKPGKTPINSLAWGALQGHTVENSRTVNYANRHGRLIFDKTEDSRWFFPGGIPEDIAELARDLRPQNADLSQNYVFVTFHQSYAYEDFIEGIRPDTNGGDEGSLTYELADGVFLRAARSAMKLAGFAGSINELSELSQSERQAIFKDAPPYAVFIDEINRGNVSRVFGELITLIEDDKRLGASGELIVTLPYSRRRFGVPPNLHIIGTMNTADRSVEALDTALRRRFAFVECGPDASVLNGIKVEESVDVAQMLRTINARLELLIDRDHLIGHAFFVGLREAPTIERLKAIFSRSLLPLLSEYFYADLGRIGLVLGSAFVRRSGRRISLARFDHEAADQLSERAVYQLTPAENLSTADFKAIYEAPEA